MSNFIDSVNSGVLGTRLVLTIGLQMEAGQRIYLPPSGEQVNVNACPDRPTYVYRKGGCVACRYLLP